MSSGATAVVVGGGTMGSGIAYVLAGSGIRVQVVEPDPDRRASILSGLAGVREGAVARGLMPPEEAVRMEGMIETIADLAVVDAPPTVLIEAVPEILELKQSVLQTAQGLAPTLLATNTSSISIDSIAEGLADPGALIGLHFFNPVWVNSLVEIVVGDRTRQAVVDDANDLVARIGKESIIVLDRPGFATSRLGVLIGLEAIRMVEEGVATPASIDRAMELGYRHPMGPLRLTDLVGLDVRLAIAENLARVYGERFEPPDLLRSMVADGLIGKKAGRGFYEWPQFLA